jgi:NAD(P)-dependent dehydrogenase (short-subunit alcohol dehydrogenase family)
MELGLSDKVCVVTGSTAGIGIEVARLLQEEGAKVVTSGRREEGIGDLHVSVDLSRPGEPERLIDAAIERFGRVDCLVNNVGWAEIHSFEELSEEIWERSWQLNVMSAVRAIQAVLPGMRERGEGAIVNVSSTAGKRPSGGMPEYSVTKAAMLSLSRLVADLYARDGIRSNAVTPGPTETDAWLRPGGLADQQGERAEIFSKVGAGRPLGRLARPTEIAAVVVFLCSGRASYVTGAAWSADGGTVQIII